MQGDSQEKSQRNASADLGYQQQPRAKSLGTTRVAFQDDFSLDFLKAPAPAREVDRSKIINSFTGSF